MAITAVASQEGGARNAAGATVTRAFGSNVTAGNTIIVIGMSFNNGASDPFVSGDCTRVAASSTATVGAITLDKQVEATLGGFFVSVGIWSCQVTGSGSCTMQLAQGAGIQAINIASGEYTSSVGAISFDTGQTNSASSAGSTTPDSGSVTTTRNGLIVGGLTVDTGGTVTITPDGAFTQIFEIENGSTDLVSAAERRIVTGSVADSASWTLGTSSPWVAAVAAYVEPAGSTNTTLTPGVGAEALTGRAPTMGFSINMPDVA